MDQMEFYLEDTSMAGFASAWAMAKRSPREYRRKVDALLQRMSLYLTLAWIS